MYDCIIIGAGISGMTAAIYLKRAGKKVLVLEKETIGGQISSSLMVSNYPGFVSISGPELISNIYDQLVNLDIPLEIEEVKSITTDKIKKVVTDYNTYETKTIIISTGARYRLLKLPNEENLIGNGIHFCVACDGAFYKEKDVAVVGGGNTALVNALSLSDICKTVYIIQNLDTGDTKMVQSQIQNLEQLTGEIALQEKIKEKDNIVVLTSSIVKKINGEGSLESVIIENEKIEEELKLDGMFISIGLVPQNEIFKDIIKLDENNYIDSNDCNTNVEGIFTAGDCRTKKFRQLTTASGDGTIAALLAIDYLNNN